MAFQKDSFSYVGKDERGINNLLFDAEFTGM